MDGVLAALQVGFSVSVRPEPTAVAAVEADRAELTKVKWVVRDWKDEAVSADGWSGHQVEVEVDKGDRTGFYTKRFIESGGKTVEVVGFVVSASAGGAASTAKCGVRDLVRAHVQSAAPATGLVDVEELRRARSVYNAGLPTGIAMLGEATSKMNAGDYDGAVRGFTAALAVCDGLTAAHNNLAWSYLHTSPPDLKKAVHHAEVANELTGGVDPYVLDTLAYAYERDGRQRKAVEVAKRCVEAAPTFEPCRARLASGTGRK